MSYLALARKWRPIKFNQVVGQSHVLTALENALAQNRLHHAYLFSGTRGVGKTTIGRLFTKGLNCETGITSTPCGECATCKEIDEGRFVDLLEIDAASRTKVEDTRELLDNVQYKPARGRFKVYLIDEVHMLSRHSFNALLKTLEEPPEYVKFLLATTDPQKLPVTILSRCLQFHLKPISVDAIHEQLDHILSIEQVMTESRALGMIAHAADGSMRDALSLADQAIALGNGSVLLDSVAHMLGTLDTDQALHLLDAISTKQPQLAMDRLLYLAQNGVEWDGLLQQLAVQLHRIAMFQALPSTLDRAQPDAEKIDLLSRALSPQDVQLYYQIALKGRQDLTFSPSSRIGVEMVILRMMAFRPVSHSQANSINTSVDSSVLGSIPDDSQNHTMSKDQSLASWNNNDFDTKSRQDVPQHETSTINDRSTRDDQVISQSTAEQPIIPDTESTQPEQAPSRRSSSPISGLRHQLRSQRKGLTSHSEQIGNSRKKTKATSVSRSETVLDRVAQKHSSALQMSPLLNSQPIAVLEKNDKKEEAYRWKPILSPKEQPKTELTPTQLKQALEHEKTPEMAQKLVVESLEQNDWAKLISQLETAKLTQQLALNSYFERNDASILLTLRPQQAHLNTERVQRELLQALNRVLGQECHLSIEIGTKGETPLELRDKLYQGKLQQAFISLESDENIRFIERRFAAELDKESVRPI